ncbi:hypothetical protein ACTXT7_003931 [Hymenolepis weldensis]
MSRRRSLGVIIDTRLGIYMQIDKHTADPPVDTEVEILSPVNHSNRQYDNIKSQALVMSFSHFSHVVLLDHVENAIHIFSKFVNSSVDRQEGMGNDEDDESDFTEISALVPEALAGLAAAVNDLRARLFCDTEGNDDDDNGDGVDDDVNILSMDFRRRFLNQQKTTISPLEFTISLQSAEDSDEISESEI